MATIHVVPVLSDNYSYLIADDATKTAAAVDPVEPAKVLEAAGALGLTITKVLTTHNHWDHAGGNSEMAKLVPGVEIVGGQGDNASAVTKEVGHEDELQLGSTTIVCIGTPCHTPGHVSYFLPGGSIDAQIEGDAVPAPAVFTGDTLFIAGCGNFNSGTPEQMHTALIERLGKLPGETRCYVGHEYTLKNLEFAATVEPGNSDIQAKIEWATSQIKAGRPTVPSTIAEEHKTNPFMRITEDTVMQYTGQSDPVSVLAEVRRRKTEWGRKH